MSNIPNHPGTDTPEPILPGTGDDDAIGQPLPGGDGPSPDGGPGEDVPVIPPLRPF